MPRTVPRRALSAAEPVAKALDRVGRWFRHSATGQWVGAHLGALYIRLAVWTTRWQIIGQENYDEAVDPARGVIAAVWHGRLFLSPTWAPKGRHSVAMISNNRDGDLISAIVRRFGIRSVRGSSYDHAKRRDKGGAVAFSGAETALLDHKALVCITPDGPRGPRMRAHPGAAMLAIQTGLPVIPMTFSTRRGKTSRGWDRFLIPWPFGRGVQIYGALLWPPKPGDEAALSAFLTRIEEALTEITNQADDLCGRQRVEPGPPAGP